MGNKECSTVQASRVSHALGLVENNYAHAHNVQITSLDIQSASSVGAYSLLPTHMNVPLHSLLPLLIYNTWAGLGVYPSILCCLYT